MRARKKINYKSGDTMLEDKYYDIYLLAQKNLDALYYVVSFDIVNSKLLSPKERYQAQINIIMIVKYVYDKLLESEKKLNKQVVLKDKRFVRPWDIKNKYNGNFIDPLIFGDSFSFTVMRDTVTKDEIVNLVNKCKESINMKENFHIADGYYETNEYEEGNRILYRGYCLQILQNMHKPTIKQKIILK